MGNRINELEYVGSDLKVLLIEVFFLPWLQDQPNAYNLFQYGPELGDVNYRKSVAKLLTEEYQAPVDV